MRRSSPTEPRPPLRWFVTLALLGASVLIRPALADEPKPSDNPPRPEPTDRKDSPATDGEKADPPTPRRVGPTVRSVNALADQRRPSAGDPYDGSIDWRSIPAWQQTSFFGIRAKGSFFVFVVDCSGSMDDDLRIDRARQELRRCINSLRYPQRFLVIFFNNQSIPMAGGIPQSADTKSKRAAMAWLNSIVPEGETDPRSSMKLALGLRPDAVFLLTDGEFPNGTETTILSRNPDRIPIHCIDLGGSRGTEQLRAIAEESGGRYLARTGSP
ncbi:vWA domain-containing protein [Tautonia rosea]|uniref:vWA domain-containing protein n=1 Tax=Tautonia rosea TaxID=2728037 RepID=UPI0014754FC3|nr:VWA domain-containing protein [Tautonia rosea]